MIREGKGDVTGSKNRHVVLIRLINIKLREEKQTPQTYVFISRRVKLIREGKDKVSEGKERHVALVRD